MEKKIWTRPMAEVETFAANEYVAACYKINCNVGAFKSQWSETNGVAGLQTTSQNGVPADTKIVESRYGTISGCKKWHKGIIRDDPPAVNGYIVYSNGSYDPVFWWEERLGSTYNQHATYLGREDYETNPNAS